MVLAAVVAIAILAGVALPTQAATAQDGVHFDPDSPAGKEYALPLDQARDEASGGAADRAPGERAPLFGAGVSGGGSGSEGVIGRDGKMSGRGREGGVDTPGSRASNRSGHEVRLAAAGNGYPLMRGLGMVAGIVLLGGVLALGFRGLQRASLR
jgi:hypothetical protein